MTAVEVVHAYFAAIRAKDADSLRALFTDDGELVTLAGTFTGPDAIAGFYRDIAFQTDDLWPEPGPPIVEGRRVAVEIRLRVNGNVSLVGDFFTLRDDQIARLLICSGPPVD
jgi:ketosteroid isomerase-like protein